MPLYLVSWEIHVDAENPREAVEQAIESLPIEGGSSLATVFTVDDPETQTTLSFDIAEDWK